MLEIWSWARGILMDVANLAILYVAWKVYKQTDEVEGLLKQIRDK